MTDSSQEPSLGLKRGSVTLVAFDPRWAAAFAEERDEILLAIGDQVVAIEHIGSTAVPGMPSKPIIDINVAISSLEVAEQLIEPLDTLGYQYMPERWFMDRYFFPKGPESRRTHHLNLCEISSETAWLSKIWFRDYLIDVPQAQMAYADLKLELAQRYTNDRNAYTEAKSKFVQEITELAKAKYSLEPTGDHE